MCAVSQVRWPSVIITPSSSGLNGGRTRTLDPASKSKLDETLLLKTLQSTFGRNARGDDGASDAGSSIGLGRGMGIRRPASSMSFRSDARGGGGGVDIEGISRRFFDGEAGLEFVAELILQDDETTSHMCVCPTALPRFPVEFALHFADVFSCRCMSAPPAATQ